MRDCKSCKSRRSSFIPKDPGIKYVTYNAVMVGLSRVGKPYFRPYSRPPEIPHLEDAFVNLNRNTLENRQITLEKSISAVHSDSVQTPPNQQENDDAINPKPDNEHSVATSDIDKGPFAFWHGRRPVLSDMGRVTIWVNDTEGTRRKRKIHFSAHGFSSWILPASERREISGLQ